MLKTTIFGLVLSMLLMGCGPKEFKEGAGKFGMLSSEMPEYAATEFFNGVYKDTNLNTALKYSSPRLQRLMRSYHTNKAVQKHILNMRFDTVKMKLTNNSAGRSEFAEEMMISIFFEGKLNGEIIKDLRVVELLRIDKKWKVDHVSMK
jgi:hypothetical protein